MNMTDMDEKARIESAALERFLESGVYKVTLDEIAADLRISKKTVYKFFPSKEDLLRAAVHMRMHRIERAVDDIVASDKPFEAKMTELLMVIGTLVRRLTRQFQVDLQRFAPRLWTEIDTFRRERVFSKMRKMFQQAKDEKVFREDLNIDLFFLVFLSTIQGIMNPQTLSQQSFSAEDAFHGIFKILFEGALTQEARHNFKLFDEILQDDQFTRTI